MSQQHVKTSINTKARKIVVEPTIPCKKRPISKKSSTDLTDEPQALDITALAQHSGRDIDFRQNGTMPAKSR